MIGNADRTNKSKALTDSTDQVAAFDVLYERILSSQYVPGERLTIERVSRDIGFGVTATRYAIKRLCAVGGLRTLPNRTVEVPSLTRTEFSNIITVLQELEIECIRRIVLAPTAINVHRLETTLHAYRSCLDKADYAAVRELAIAFWFELYSMAQSPSLMTMIEMAWLQVGPRLSLLHRVGKQQRFDWAEKRRTVFEEIVAALKRRDYEGGASAVRAMMAHHTEWYTAIEGA
ncbi:MAG: GntR family transcriptional regulator [Pseudomonadota bacterium]